MFNKLRADPSAKGELLRHLKMFYAGTEDILTPIQGGFVDLRIEEEDGVTIPASRLREREGDSWPRPEGATDEQAHLMVQVMEAWFLADPDTLANFYRQGFLRNSLSPQKDIERLDKRRVFESLSHASNGTQKGSYHKTNHRFELLELIDPTIQLLFGQLPGMRINCSPFYRRGRQVESPTEVRHVNCPEVRSW